MKQKIPKELEPVLAKIAYVNELGTSTWFEVVYFCEEWCSYSDSDTFEDGEQVVEWIYCNDCFNNFFNKFSHFFKTLFS